MTEIIDDNVGKEVLLGEPWHCYRRILYFKRM